MRKSTIAGSWYPGDKQELHDLIESLLEQADAPDMHGRLTGLIAPHAGIQFSGQAAACAYRLVRGQNIKRVILVGPSHYQAFRGLAVSGVDAYETPLGLIPVDTKSTAALCELPLFKGPSEAELPEHSLEMHLPFLQTVLPDCELLPLIAGRLSQSDCADAAQALQEVIDEHTIIAASSDFTHYGQRFGFIPCTDAIRENLHTLDTGAIDCILKKDCGAFLHYVAETGATICGASPIALLLSILSPESQGQLLSYYTSGDILGDWNDTVSYASIVFTAQ